MLLCCCNKEHHISTVELLTCYFLCYITPAGKSELINSLLGRPVLSTSAFRDATKRIRVVKGNVAGAQSVILSVMLLLCQ
jgi:hypothetical protein